MTRPRIRTTDVLGVVLPVLLALVLVLAIGGTAHAPGGAS